MRNRKLAFRCKREVCEVFIDCFPVNIKNLSPLSICEIIMISLLKGLWGLRGYFNCEFAKKRALDIQERNIVHYRKRATVPSDIIPLPCVDVWEWERGKITKERKMREIERNGNEWNLKKKRKQYWKKKEKRKHTITERGIKRINRGDHHPCTKIIMGSFEKSHQTNLSYKVQNFQI